MLKKLAFQSKENKSEWQFLYLKVFLDCFFFFIKNFSRQIHAQMSAWDHKILKVWNTGLMMNLDLWVAHFTEPKYCSKLNKGSVCTKPQKSALGGPVRKQLYTVVVLSSARCVHLSTQEEEVHSSWGDGKRSA